MKLALLKQDRVPVTPQVGGAADVPVPQKGQSPRGYNVVLLQPIAGYLIDSTPASAQSTPRFFSDRLLHLQYRGTLHHPHPTIKSSGIRLWSPEDLRLLQCITSPRVSTCWRPARKVHNQATPRQHVPGGAIPPCPCSQLTFSLRRVQNTP